MGWGSANFIFMGAGILLMFDHDSHWQRDWLTLNLFEHPAEIITQECFHALRGVGHIPKHASGICQNTMPQEYSMYQDDAECMCCTYSRQNKSPNILCMHRSCTWEVHVVDVMHFPVVRKHNVKILIGSYNQPRASWKK